MNDKDLDRWITGDFNPNAPFNQPDSEPQIDEIWECLDAENYDRAYELLSEIRKEVNLLRELCKQTNKEGDKAFMINRLTKIYNAL